MSLPVRVRCTDERGEVVYVDLSKGWIWQQVSWQGKRYTALFVPNVSTVGVDKGQERVECVLPGRQLVCQTPGELRVLELDAYKQMLAETMRIRRDLEAEADAPPAPEPQGPFKKP